MGRLFRSRIPDLYSSDSLADRYAQMSEGELLQLSSQPDTLTQEARAVLQGKLRGRLGQRAISSMQTVGTLPFAVSVAYALGHFLGQEVSRP